MKRIVLIFFLFLLPFSLVSCKKYDDINDFKGKIIKFENEVSLSDFSSLNDLLDENRNNNLLKDYVITTYEYSKIIDESDSLTRETNSVIQSVIEVDRENKTILAKREGYEKTTSKSNIIDNEKNSDFKYNLGMQEERNNEVFEFDIDNKCKQKTKLSWTTLLTKYDPQNLVNIALDTSTLYFIDNNVYTKFIDNDYDYAIEEQLLQVKVEDDKLTYLSIKYRYTKPDVLVDKSVSYFATYKEIKFKDVKLEKTNLDDYRLGYVGELS